MSFSTSKHKKRNRSVSDTRESFSFEDLNSGYIQDKSEKKTLSLEKLSGNDLRTRNTTDIKANFRRTMKGVKKIFGTQGTSLKKSTSTPNITKALSQKSSSDYPSNKDCIEQRQMLVSHEPRRRKVSWATKIENWLDDNKSPRQSQRRKVSWVSGPSFSLDNGSSFVDNELRKPSYSDSQLNDVHENQRAEQITIHCDNEKFNPDEDFSNVKTQINANVLDDNKVEQISKENHTPSDDTMDSNTVSRKYERNTNAKDITTTKNRRNKDEGLNKSNNEMDDTYYKLEYALDDLHMLDKKNGSKEVLHKTLSGEPRKKKRSNSRSRHSSEKEDDDGFLSVEDIHRIVENEVRYKLDGQTFNSKDVTIWCKDISNTVRDKLKLITRNKRKVIATTYIGSKVNDSGVHVSVKCQKNMNTDDFLTVALEGDDMVIWVTLLLADY